MSIRAWNWPLIGFFGVVSAIIIIGGVSALEPTFCNAGELAKAAKQQDVVVFACWEFWLNRYQGFLVGTAAVISAAVSVSYVRRQIAQTDQHEQERYGRERAAARTLLPIALSALCEYAEQSVQALIELENAVGLRTRSTRSNGVRMPQLPTSALAQITALVRTMPPNSIEAFAKLAQQIQVHNARVAGLHLGGRLPAADLSENILDAVEIYARASQLFAFARFESETVSTMLFADDMKSSIRVTGAELNRTGPLHEAIDRRSRVYPQRVSPQNS